MRVTGVRCIAHLNNVNNQKDWNAVLLHLLFSSNCVLALCVVYHGFVQSEKKPGPYLPRAAKVLQ